MRKPSKFNTAINYNHFIGKTKIIYNDKDFCRKSTNNRHFLEHLHISSICNVLTSNRNNSFIFLIFSLSEINNDFLEKNKQKKSNKVTTINIQINREKLTTISSLTMVSFHNNNSIKLECKNSLLSDWECKPAIKKKKRDFSWSP